MNTKERLQKLTKMHEEILRQKGTTTALTNQCNLDRNTILVVDRQDIKNKLKKYKGLNDVNQALTLDEFFQPGRDFNGPILFDNNMFYLLLKEALYAINQLEDKLDSIKNVLNNSTEG